MIRVLLVDDHPVVRAGLSAVLNTGDDIDVVAQAGTGREALDILASTQVDVVVSDIQMPQMDGVELTAELGRMGGPPVLILTTFDTENLIVAAMNAGAQGYLLKDAPPEELTRAVRAVNEGRPVMSDEVTVALTRRLTQPRTSLSARELEILQAVATGHTNKEIAQELFISQATVKTHLVHIFDKLGVDNRTSAVAKAREQQLID
ncbi:putative bacteriochlorophyll 4-vinyl reductase [Brevibacterium mcbrellneri ATCC 49030]|uniref:Putative bacteriochlorophyll 4-vinyl reductase n=1 Tax=Brevibacterium mcbrellneri ATCC 49030 TaxID=585530 RepID=D4YKR3_9MICO|nr:response regulator transcription factor [Brevibacterium mcbrellneri]EFG48266.1 putative bacteriochlorophyll 4-vinyl reductase [Brevibacterium mcbrellneri ATCC 49030]